MAAGITVCNFCAIETGLSSMKDRPMCAFRSEAYQADLDGEEPLLSDDIEESELIIEEFPCPNVFIMKNLGETPGYSGGFF